MINNLGKGIDDLIQETKDYPAGTSKEYTDKVNSKHAKALEFLNSKGIDLDKEYTESPSKEGGLNSNVKEIMNKYVFDPFHKAYPNGNNEVWDRDYKELFDSIDAYADKRYNDWYIQNKK